MATSLYEPEISTDFMIGDQALEIVNGAVASIEPRSVSGKDVDGKAGKCSYSIKEKKVR